MFGTRAEANEWCKEYGTRRPEFECNVMTLDEMGVARFGGGGWIEYGADAGRPADS